MDNEKRMIQDYEVKTAIHIGEKEIVFAENIASDDPYMVCDCSWANPLSMEVYSNAVGSRDYIEAMEAFVSRVTAAVEQVKDQRVERGITGEPLTASDCIPGSNSEHYEGKLIIIKPESMTASARTADQQLLVATGGNGCNPNARGQAVFCKDLFTGKTLRWERYDVAGIAAPERIPAWAQEKLQALGITPEPAASLPEQKVYMASLNDARENGELPTYKESRKLNAECAHSIKDAINDSHDGKYSYNLSAALKSVTEKYGAERVHVVLANTLGRMDYDGRFSCANKEWAQGVPLPNIPKEQRSEFVCEAHPAILDGFVSKVRTQQQEIKEKRPSVTNQLKEQPKSTPAKNKEKTRDDKGR